jgi:DNA-binding NarL/FixJ family response regulator
MINVVIADHQAIFRAGIAKVLAVEEDMRIVGQPQSAEQLLNVLDRLRVRVLLFRAASCRCCRRSSRLQAYVTLPC